MTDDGVRSEELSWYWHSAEGDMGLHAAPLEPSYGGGEHGVTRRQSKAVARYNLINLVLGGMEEATVKLLRLAHMDVPPALRPRFAALGTLALVVVDMAPSPEWVVKAKEPELVKLTARARQKVARAVRDFEKEHARWAALEKKR